MLSNAEITQVSFRQATLADVNLVYDWSNDELVREHSYNSKQIEYSSHVLWFNQKITKGKDIFLIATIQDKPAALIRFQGVPQKTEVGVVIDKNFRGKGLAATILKGAIANYLTKFDSSIFAYIKKNNLASVKAFTKAGFVLHNEEIIKGHPSFVYVFTSSITN